MPTNQDRLNRLLCGGTFTALITPFKEPTTIDLSRFRDQVEYQIKAKVAGIVAVGTTGESPTLRTGEHYTVIENTVQCADGRVLVIAGTGSNCTDEAIGLTQHAQRVGADAALIVVPYYNKPTQEGLYQHYKAIADAVDIPIILYDIPGRCGVTIDVKTVLRLENSCPNIIGIKEASGDLTRVTKLRNAITREFLIFSGNDGDNVEMILLGADGVISVLSNLLPEEVVKLVTAARAGDFATAQLIHDELAELVKLLFAEGNPSGIKCAMELSGLDSGILRLPLVPVSDVTRAQMVEVLTELGLMS